MNWNGMSGLPKAKEFGLLASQLKQAPIQGAFYMPKIKAEA